MDNRELEALTIKALSKVNSKRLWSALSHESGPYQIDVPNHDAMQFVQFIANAVLTAPVAEPLNEFQKCPHPECGRFKDGAGWSCRAMRDNACVRNDA